MFSSLCFAGRVVDWSVDALKTASGASGVDAEELEAEDFEEDDEEEEEEDDDVCITTL